MSQFILKPSLEALIKNPPPLSVWWNSILYKLSPRMLRPYHTPISLVIYLTKRCNFKCDFCFTYDDLNKPDWKSFELNVEGLEKILQSPFGRRSLRVGFLGGEPFLNSDIFDFLKIVHNQGKITTIVTNASLVKEEHRKNLLANSPTMMGISLYDNNIDAVANFSEWLADNKKHFWVQTVVSSKELPKMRASLEFAKKHKIKNLILSNYNPVRTEQIEEAIFDDNQDFKNEKVGVVKLAREMGINLVLPHPISRHTLKRTCQMSFSYVHVDSSGTLGACCFRPPNPKFGSVFEKDSWNNKANLELRETFLNKEKPLLKECRNCENLGRDLYGV